MLSREGAKLPISHLLIRPFIACEAVLSSRIEENQATLGEILAQEAGANVDRNPDDLQEEDSMTGDDNRKTLQSIITGENHSINGVGKLKDFLKQNKEITINKDTFAYALQYQKTTKEAIVHEILLHFIQNPGKQSLEQVIQCLDRAIKPRIYAKNNPIRNLDEELRSHINFKDEKGNTLLHHAVIVSLSGGMILGLIITPVLVASIAAGLAMYFLSQDYEQAKAIEKTISTVSSEISVDGATAANDKEGPQPTYLRIADPSNTSYCDSFYK
ncbi:unnamed protein product [Parnassius apollo]|uniref:(apollo) hypothetical protein n=1 Tax=Parnassius apollo TaxID=110799 RepID=A0A8S3YE83_PARAO|nr:unnamed protein product [Parnassius apollo]